MAGKSYFSDLVMPEQVERQSPPGGKQDAPDRPKSYFDDLLPKEQAKPVVTDAPIAQAETPEPRQSSPISKKVEEGLTWLKERSGVPEIAEAAKMLWNDESPYDRDKAQNDDGEFYKRLSYMRTYMLSLGGTVGPKGLRENLAAQAEDFTGMGPALAPAAGKAVTTALEWGVLYPALFKTVGFAGASVNKIPQVQKAGQWIAEAGGINAMADKFPRTVAGFQKALGAIGKGAAVGGITGSVETINTDMTGQETVEHILKSAGTMATVAGAFSVAGSIDTAIMSKRLRKESFKQISDTYNKTLSQLRDQMQGAPPAKRQALGSQHKAILRQMEMHFDHADKTITQLESDLTGVKKGLYSDGQQRVISSAQQYKDIWKYKPGKGPGTIVNKSMRSEAFQKKPAIKMPETTIQEAFEGVQEAAARLTRTGRAKAGLNPRQSTADFGVAPGVKPAKPNIKLGPVTPKPAPKTPEDQGSQYTMTKLPDGGQQWDFKTEDQAKAFFEQAQQRLSDGTEGTATIDGLTVVLRKGPSQAPGTPKTQTPPDVRTDQGSQEPVVLNRPPEPVPDADVVTPEEVADTLPDITGIEDAAPSNQPVAPSNRPVAPSNEGVTPSSRPQAPSTTPDLQAEKPVSGGDVTPKPAEKSYRDFAGEYQHAFDEAMKYTSEQVGQRVWTDQMANLADDYPEHLARFEKEVEEHEVARKIRKNTNDWYYGNKLVQPTQKSGIGNKAPGKILHINTDGQIQVEGHGSIHWNPWDFEEAKADQTLPKPTPVAVDAPPKAGGPSFSSGLTKNPTDMDNEIEQGNPVGISAFSNPTKPIRKKMTNYANNGGKVFIDSGAFSDLKSGSDTDWENVFHTYKEIVGAIDRDKRDNVHIVAPDVVGDNKATTELLRGFRDQVRWFMDEGVRVIIPVQTGGGSIEDNYYDAIEAIRRETGLHGQPLANTRVHNQMGLDNTLIGIPYNAKAWSQEEVLDFLRDQKALRDAGEGGIHNLNIHLLGGGPTKVQALMDAINAEGLPGEIQGDASPKSISKRRKGKRDEPEAPKQAPGIILAHQVKDHLSTGPMNAKQFWAYADKAYGGTRAEGTYGPSDAYDAMELGWNLDTVDRDSDDPTVGYSSAANIAELIEADLMAKMPSQTNRSGEKEKFQQFSTPPHYAYGVNWLANISHDDVVLEPSAGVGGLLSYAIVAEPKKVIGNEISERRAELLKELGAEVTTEDAEQIHNILGARGVKPTVIVMNPPFSHAGHRMGDKKIIGTDLKHIDAALKLLQPGGRLVAIMGAPLHGGETQTFQRWLEATKGKYNVRANIKVQRKVYKKYGTDFPTKVLMIDKTGPTEGEIIGGEVDTISQMMYALSEARNDRGKPATTESDRPGIPDQTRPQRPVRTPSARPGTTGNNPKRPLGEGQGDDAAPSRPDAGVGTEAGDGDVRPEPRTPVEPKRPDSGDGVSPEQPVRVDAGEKPTVKKLTVGNKKATRKGELTDDIFQPYTPAKFILPGTKTHPASLVESSAMADTLPPDLDYELSIPQHIVESGDLSDVQLEFIAYMGQANKNFFTNESGVEVRQGAFLGDGTGLGKGRIIAGTILDNWNKGRKKAVWVSEGNKLFKDSVEYWEAVGGQEGKIFKTKGMKGDITQPDGVAFVTYAWLRSSPQDGDETNLDRLIKWLGDDFEGVIAFDESHNMGNVGLGKSGREAAQQALAGLELDSRTPKSRIMYSSATGATEVSNLAYAERLGLWGPGTAFTSKAAFVEQIDAGGVAAMELVARDMKAMGLYVSRRISFNDGTDDGTVEFDRITHVMTEKDTRLWNDVTNAWQVILRNMRGVLDATQATNKDRGRAEARFWTTNQQFLNDILTSMKVQTTMERVEKDLANGESAIIQLTRTMGQATAEALRNIDDADLDGFSMNPRGTLIHFLEMGFPTQAYETFTDDNGKVSSRPIIDSDGRPVEDMEAVAKKNEMIDLISNIPIPDNSLDQIIERFGWENVAEITGRTKRAVKVIDEAGVPHMKKQSMSDKFKDSQVADFMAGKKRVLIFSEAGGTGASYHASLSAKNQEKRNHYLLQGGWRADKATQGLGRAHRSFQKWAPKIHLVETEIPGEKRFISTIARKLAQMGALVSGERRASGGLFDASDNLESPQAIGAMWDVIEDIIDGNGAVGFAMNPKEFEEQTGLDVTNSTKMNTLDMNRFLNRILNMNLDRQQQVFESFDSHLETRVQRAISDGTLDQGLENYRADSVEKLEDRVVYHHEKTGNETRYINLKVGHKVEPLEWRNIQNRPIKFYVKSTANGRVWGVEDAQMKTDVKTGRVHQRYHLRNPMGSKYIHQTDVNPTEPGKEAKYEKIDTKTAQQLWNDEVTAAPELKYHEIHVIAGIMLPIWDRLKGSARVFRIMVNDGEIVLGRVIPPGMIDQVLRNLGAEKGQETILPEVALAGLVDGSFNLEMANGWTLSKSKVQGEPRIEIDGPDYYDMQTLVKAYGLFTEKIASKVRLFMPTGEAYTMEKFLDAHPVAKVRYHHNRDLDTDFDSPSAGFAGFGRPVPSAPDAPGTKKVSAIVRDKIDTGNPKAESFRSRTRGFGHSKSGGFFANITRGAKNAMGVVGDIRYLPRLPKTEAFAEIREAFRLTHEVRRQAINWSVSKMKWALQPITGTKREVAMRREAVYLKIIADDLWEDVQLGVALPGDLDLESVRAMKAEGDRAYHKYGSVRETVGRMRQVQRELTDTMAELGWIDKAQAKKFYFPHKVLKYLRKNPLTVFGIGTKHGKPAKRYLRKRKGGHDYATDVLDILTQHWAEVKRDISTTQFLEKTLDQEQAKFRKANTRWRVGDEVPDGYREVAVLPGRYYYQAHGVTQEMAKALMDQDLLMLEDIMAQNNMKGMKDVRTMLAVGRKRTFVVREEVANQLDDMPTVPVSTGHFYKTVKALNTAIKKQILFNPLYAAPFHLTNFVGDWHKLSVAAPGALNPKYTIEYLKALQQAHRDGTLTPRLKMARENGVVGSGFFMADIDATDSMLPIIAKMDISSASEVSFYHAKKLWTLLEKLGNGREDVLRYQSFAYMLDQQEKGKKGALRFALKDVAVVRGLSSNKVSQAAKVSRDIMGDYEAVGKTGRALADTVMPFYRWIHLNTPWWPRMIAEYAKRGEAGRLTAAFLAAVAPYVLAAMWNYSDEKRRRYEESLPYWRRWSFHIINKKGTGLRYVPLPLDDFLNIIGVPESIADYQRYENGMITFPQLVGAIAANLGTSPLSSGVNAVGGVAGVARDLVGLRTYPRLSKQLQPIVNESGEINKRTAIQAVKTAVGAPGQLLEAAARDDTNKVKELTWRSLTGIRTYEVDIERVVTRLYNSTYKKSGNVVDKSSPTGKRKVKKGQPHKGKERDVDLLRLQLQPTLESLKEKKTPK